MLLITDGRRAQEHLFPTSSAEGSPSPCQVIDAGKVKPLTGDKPQTCDKWQRPPPTAHTGVAGPQTSGKVTQTCKPGCPTSLADTLESQT